MEHTTTTTTFRAVLSYGNGTGIHLFAELPTAEQAWADVDRLTPLLIDDPDSGDSFFVMQVNVEAAKVARPMQTLSLF